MDKDTGKMGMLDLLGAISTSVRRTPYPPKFSTAPNSKGHRI